MIPLLSIIIPTLDVDVELRRCVDSVCLAIPDSEMREIVLVLPSSKAADAAERFPDARVVAESRPSVYSAMNDGVAASTGRYLYFLGKDDILLPAVHRVLSLLAAESPSAVFSDVYWGSKGRHRARPSRFQILVFNVCHQGIVYSREAITTHGPFMRRFRTHADHLLNIRLLWDPNLRRRVRYLAVPIAWYAATGLSSRTFDVNFVRAQPAIIGRYLGPIAAALWQPFKWFRLRWHRSD
ncbi:glycosyltransferase [Variovorax sp. LG9.2]|uniref:glycosyltransferase n=1 Tax=Variovorax sp. LG9.2 TaxID=3048626 RepID=UPI002B2284E8|nr:glycosyltransferase [Variovorax sp. LG9.2]